MHAFLLVNANDQKINEKLKSLISTLNARSIEYSVAKIEDVRILRRELIINKSENSVILLRNIDSATKEAQNALLKSLEEPPKNVYYLLTAQNRDAVPQTILSRCRIFVFRSETGEVGNKTAENFINSETGKRLQIIDQFKKREPAVEFVENLIRILHKDLHTDNKNSKTLGLYLKKSQDALNALKANGNTTIQLTNLVVNLDQIDLPDIMDKV